MSYAILDPARIVPTGGEVLNLRTTGFRAQPAMRVRIGERVAAALDHAYALTFMPDVAKPPPKTVCPVPVGVGMTSTCRRV